jgi:hypothetical protein
LYNADARIRSRVTSDFLSLCVWFLPSGNDDLSVTSNRLSYPRHTIAVAVVVNAAQRNAAQRILYGESTLDSLRTAISVTSPVVWKQSTDLFQSSKQACSVHALLAEVVIETYIHPVYWYW